MCAAVKSKVDRDAVLQAVLDDRIDIIATDHAPHTWDEKSMKFIDAPSGLPLIQHSLQTLLEFYHDGIFTLEQIVKKTSHNIATRFQVKDRGFIREGYFADMVIVDIDKPYNVNKDNILYKCGWSPFEDTTFRSSINMTILNGSIVFENNSLSKDLSFGHQLEFNR